MLIVIIIVGAGLLVLFGFAGLASAIRYHVCGGRCTGREASSRWAASSQRRAGHRWLPREVGR